MPQYLSPGVYVEEVPSAIKPIAGVSTSTAAFIGIIPDSFPVPPSIQIVGEKVTADGTERVRLTRYPVSEADGTYQIQIPVPNVLVKKIENDHANKVAYARVSVAPTAADTITVSYSYWVTREVTNAKSKLKEDLKTLELTDEPT